MLSLGCINLCNCDMFSVANVYLDHLKFCVVCIDGQCAVLCDSLTFTAGSMCMCGICSHVVVLVCLRLSCNPMRMRWLLGM